MSSPNRSKRAQTAAKSAAAQEPLGRKKPKAFTVFDETIEKYRSENGKAPDAFYEFVSMAVRFAAYFVARFVDDRNLIVIDPKIPEKISPAPQLKSLPTIYKYPLKAGIQFLAEFPADKERYIAELVSVEKSEKDANSCVKMLQQLEQINSKTEKSRAEKQDGKRKSEAAEALLALNGKRSPRGTLSVSPEKESSMPDETGQNDLIRAELGTETLTPSGIVDVEDAATNPKTGAPTADPRSTSVFDKPLPVPPRSNPSQPTDEAKANANQTTSTGRTQDSNSTGKPKRTEPMSAPEVLLYPYEIPKADGVSKSVLVPKYSGIRLYIDEATLIYYSKLQNRTTPGQFVSALLDALLGSREGVKKLERTYNEKRASIPANSKTKIGMKNILSVEFIKCFKMFLDGEGYNTSVGEWMSKAMNRWKKRQFERYGLACGCVGSCGSSCGSASSESDVDFDS